MEAVLRAIGIYLFLLLLFRMAGMRSLTEVSAFEFVLLLVIGEATQQAILGNDFSVTDACLVILTLMALIVAFCLPSIVNLGGKSVNTYTKVSNTLKGTGS